MCLLTLSFFTSQAQRVQDLEPEFIKVEKDYIKGDYKKALSKSQTLIKKVEKKSGKENMMRARALGQLAKIYEGLGKLEEYKSTVDQTLNTINAAPKDNPKEHGQALLNLTEAFIQYGDYGNAQATIDKAIKLTEENKFTDTLLVHILKSRLAEVYYYQGHLVKADAMIPDLIKFRRARVVKREPYTDSKGRIKKLKLSSREYDARARSAAEIMNLYSLIVLENGDLVKTDSLLKSNERYIRKYLSKKDVVFIDFLFQTGLLMEAENRKLPANEHFEKAAKWSNATKGVRLRPMSKQVMKLQEKRIVSHKKSSRDSQAKRRKKIYETRVVRSYGKNSIYYGHDQLVEAEVYLITQDYKKAEERVMSVLNNPTYAPKNRPERLRALKLLYEICLVSDQYLKAEGTLEQIIDSRRAMHGDNAPFTYMAHLDLANFHVQYSSKFKEAETIYVRDLNKVDKEIDHRNKHFQEYIYNYAALLEYTDRFEKAFEVLQVALNDSKKFYGEKHPKYASALERVANIYIDLGKYAEAEKNLVIANEIFKDEAHMGDYKDYSHELQTFARLYIIQGEYDEAKKVLKKSLQKQGVVGVDTKISETIDELATLNIETGKYQATEKSLNESLKLKEEKYGPVHRTLINPLNQLGHLYLITGNYIEADKCTKRAASISVQIFGESSLKYAESLKLLGNIYGSIGDYEKAEESLEKAMKILRHHYGTKHIQIATSLNDIALIKFYNNENPKKVEELLLEALNMTKESLSDKHPRYASILSNLAMFYLETGNLEKSESYLNEANAIWVAKFGESNVHSAEIYFIKGNTSYKKGDFVQAKLDYTTAKTIYYRVFENESHPGYLSALSKIGQMSYIIGDYKGAIRALDETTSRYLTYIQNYFPSLSEREKNKFWSKIQKDFEFYNTLMYKLKDQNPVLVSNAYNFALSTKALLLNSSIKVRQRIMESNDPELIHKFEDWTSKKEFLTSAVSLTSEQRKEGGIDLKILEAEIEELEKELSSRSEVFAKNFQRKQAYDWKDIRKNLLENEVAIELIRFRTFDKAFTDTIIYAALIVTPSNRSYPDVVFMNNGSDMEQKALKYYRNCMRFNVEDKHSYDNFWKPLKPYIKDNAVVYLSPDGVFNQINLETIKGADGKYVLDQNKIILVSNTRDLISRRLEEEKAAKAKFKKGGDKSDNSKIVLFGNPKYYSSSNSKNKNGNLTDSTGLAETIERKKIAQLPGAEQEVKDLYNLLNKSGLNSSAFLLDSATEGTIKDLKNIKIFHIATHGFFMEDVQADLEGINQNRAVENPLLRSGLLLKDGGDLMEKENAYEFNLSEGVLTAYEAMNLNFDHTELVVLSACETGLGKVQLGEGVYGLQRSFLVAGAKSVVMSLFKVSDEVTQELMTLFYTNWIATGDKRQSFIDAKKAIKDKYQKPIYWGAFIMVGMQ